MSIYIWFLFRWGGKQLWLGVSCVVDLLFRRVWLLSYHLHAVSVICAGRGSLYNSRLLSGGLFYSVVATRHQPITESKDGGGGSGDGYLPICMCTTYNKYERFFALERGRWGLLRAMTSYRTIWCMWCIINKYMSPFGVVFARRASPCSSLPTLPGAASAVLVSSPGGGRCFRFWSFFPKHIFVRIDTYPSGSMYTRNTVW